MKFFLENYPYKFSISDYSVADRLDAWRAQHKLADFSVSQPIDQSMDYQFVGYKLGKVSIGQWTYSTKSTAVEPLVYTLKRTESIIRKDGLDNYSFNFRFSGAINGEINGQRIQVFPTELVVVDQARPYHREIEAGNAITLLVSRDMLPYVSSSIHGTIFRNGISQLLAEYLCRLLRRMDELSSSEIVYIEQAIFNLLAAMLMPVTENLSNAKDEIQSSLYIKVKQHINQYFESPELSPEQICKVVGISRSSLYRLFEKDGGVASYIRQRRLLAIRSALASPIGPRSRISDLAYQYGFNSNTQLSRAFKQYFGHAPRETCEINAAESLASIGVATLAENADYNGWLNLR